MRELVAAWRQSPLRLTAHAWAVLLAAALMTFLLLPYAHSLYNGGHPLAGYLLHRLLLGLFLLAAAMAAVSLVALLWAGLTRGGGSAAARLGNLAKVFFLAAPAFLLAGAAALLMLFGGRVGMALG